MCGRYYVDDEETIEEMREVINEIERRYADTEKLQSMRTGEIFPTNYAPVVSANGPTIMKWGFPMHGSTQTAINARAETAAQKPLFSAALKQRRVVIPTSGFYEWSHVGGKAKDKFLFRLPGQNVLYLAGLYTNFVRPDGTREDYYTILTTAANESMQPYHDRMPVYLAAAERKTWISDTSSVGDILNRKQPELNADKIEKVSQLSLFEN